MDGAAGVSSKGTQVLPKFRRYSMGMGTEKSNDQSIRIMCPNLLCQRVLAVPSTARGKLVRCKGCGANIRIPSNRPSDAGLSPDADEKKPAAKDAPKDKSPKAA